MNRLIIAFALFIFASGCRPASSEIDVCRASLDKLNEMAVEKIVFARAVDGHDGYGFIAPACDYFVPLSIAPMPAAERRKLNTEVRRLIEQDSKTRGVGFFEAACDCRYDEDAEAVVALSVTELALTESRFANGR